MAEPGEPGGGDDDAPAGPVRDREPQAAHLQGRADRGAGEGRGDPGARDDLRGQPRERRARADGVARRVHARDALDAVDKTGDNMLQVAYAGEWSASREQTSAGIREVVRPFDWSYSTTYKGTVVPGTLGRGGSDADSGRRLDFIPTDEPIPIELLKRRDPIRFFDDVVLYESELDDNGISLLSVKLRVHDERMLLLCRLYMRLDNVVCRIRDTRIYVDFASEVVTREYSAREAGFNDVKQVSCYGLRYYYYYFAS